MLEFKLFVAACLNSFKHDQSLLPFMYNSLQLSPCTCMHLFAWLHI